MKTKVNLQWGTLPLLIAGFLLAGVPVMGMPQADGTSSCTRQTIRRLLKENGEPNPIDRARILKRLEVQQARLEAGARRSTGPRYGDGPELHGLSGSDRVLVILVEFAGTDTFTWTPGVSTWDPFGRCESTEFDGTNLGNSSASRYFAQKYGITGATNITYRGPLHNEIPRPTGSNDASAKMIWMPDFTADYYRNIIFGNGLTFDFSREDGSVVHEDYTGRSVRDYYEDLSGGAYTIDGTVLGWVQVTNSVWWYGADGLPGARSCSQRPADNGAIPGKGSARSLVADALRSAKAAYPNFNWAEYDQNGDGYIDRLWIIHAGLGEEDSPAVLNRTPYGEGGIWSHSWSLPAPLEMAPGVSAYSYIMMPENAGIAVLAHEFAHNLGAIDLYTYGDGQASSGLWTLMSDSWVGFPLGFLPEAMDPMHLDQWGWLSPLLVSDPSKVYRVQLGQASRFPKTPNLVRGVKIQLPKTSVPLAVQPIGNGQWWGGAVNSGDSRMTLRQPIHIPSGDATLQFKAAYDVEAGYDFLYVEVSPDAGASWQTVASYTDTSGSYPAYLPVSLSLAGFSGKDVLLRFRYATDGYVLGDGPFLDEIVVKSGGQVLLADNANTESGLWAYTGGWEINGGMSTNGSTQCYHLQWRNTSSSGGYDQALGDPRYRFGPVNSGMVVWYQNDRYGDNSIANYMNDGPSFGPKGHLLVVDAHPEPFVDPYWANLGFLGDRGVAFSRGSMRDAPFSQWATFDFHLDPPYVFEGAGFAGRPAVPQFSDATGYYPGLLEMGSNSWWTAQWDASTVLPSTRLYGPQGQGYVAGRPVQNVIATRGFIGTNEVMLYRTNLIATGTALSGGDGNPGSVGGAYGWNVRVVHQTDSWAEVVIWNKHSESLDDDGDGVPNWKEALAGTDPNDPASLLRISRAACAGADNHLRLEWPGATNRTYRVLCGNSPGGPFAPVSAGMPGTPPLNSWDDAGPAVSERYYRLELE